MKFGWCSACGSYRALVPDGTRGGDFMLRTHYLGGAARYAAKMGSSVPAAHRVEMERCPGSQRSSEPSRTLADPPQQALAESAVQGT